MNKYEELREAGAKALWDRANYATEDPKWAKLFPWEDVSEYEKEEYRNDAAVVMAATLTPYIDAVTELTSLASGWIDFTAGNKYNSILNARVCASQVFEVVSGLVEVPKKEEDDV